MAHSDMRTIQKSFIPTIPTDEQLKEVSLSLGCRKKRKKKKRTLDATLRVRSTYMNVCSNMSRTTAVSCPSHGIFVHAANEGFFPAGSEILPPLPNKCHNVTLNASETIIRPRSSRNYLRDTEEENAGEVRSASTTTTCWGPSSLP